MTASKNRILLIMDRDYTVNATFLRLIYQPLGVQGMKIHNRSLSQSEYINILCWSPHPDNIDINSYRIFSIIDSARSLVAEVSPSSREYQHRHVPKNISYIYEIRAVNREGREGLPARVTIQ